jgi:hypothetical protein
VQSFVPLTRTRAPIRFQRNRVLSNRVQRPRMARISGPQLSPPSLRLASARRQPPGGRLLLLQESLLGRHRGDQPFGPSHREPGGAHTPGKRLLKGESSRATVFSKGDGRPQGRAVPSSISSQRTLQAQTPVARLRCGNRRAPRLELRMPERPSGKRSMTPPRGSRRLFRSPDGESGRLPCSPLWHDPSISSRAVMSRGRNDGQVTGCIPGNGSTGNGGGESIPRGGPGYDLARSCPVLPDTIKARTLDRSGSGSKAAA